MPFWPLSSFLVRIQYGNTPDTEVILSLIQIQTSDTVQIRSRHGCHSVTYSDFPQLRDAPDTDAILFLITSLQMQFKYVPDADIILNTYSFDLQLKTQQTFLDGIFKPIPNKILS